MAFPGKVGSMMVNMVFMIMVMVMVMRMKITKNQTDTPTSWSEYTPFKHFYMVSKKNQANWAGVTRPPGLH